jgi:hypothetical protein
MQPFVRIPVTLLILKDLRIQHAANTQNLPAMY